MIISLLATAVGLLLVDRFLRPAQRDAAAVSDESAAAAQAPVEVTGSSVAVLPFVAMSSGEDDEYFADGPTEDILNSLAQLLELLVTAGTSAFKFKGQDIVRRQEVSIKSINGLRKPLMIEGE